MAHYEEIFCDLDSTRNITPADIFNIKTRGANSVFNRYHEVIIYNSSTANILDYLFVSHNSFTSDRDASKAITDHMEIAVKFSLKK